MTHSSSDLGLDPTIDPPAPPSGISRVSPLNLALLCLAIGSIGAALYLSPASAPLREEVRGASEAVSEAVGQAAGTDAWRPSTSAGATPTAPSTSSTDADLEAALTAALRRPAGDSSGAGTRAAGLIGPSTGSIGAGLIPRVPTLPTPTPGPTPTPSPTPTPTPTAKTKCWQFTWQQDAQLVYVANLSDPYGLDGAPGPHDADGIACSDLPVDPTRAASKPIGAYVPPKPSPGTKAALVTPAQDYWGFSQDGVPGDTAMLEGLAADATKAPSSVGWFASFDEPYRADLVTKSWSRGALPVVTWLPTSTTTDSHYSLSTIVSGANDAYLRRYAGDVVRADLPVVIRFAHEMNGNWYGWSAGRTDYNNSPEKYIAAWRHVWEIFDSVGANDNVIWLWSPSRVDNLRVNGTNGNTAVSASYPGDDYVDWIGASVYLRYTTMDPSYGTTFGKTMDAIAAVTDKPIFLAETAAIEGNPSSATPDLKSQWITNALNAFADSDRIIGFLWFNNVSAVVEGSELTHDWRFQSSSSSLTTFRGLIARPEFKSGTPLD